MSSKHRAPIPDLAPGERTLGGSVGHYLSRVLRMARGERFVAFDPATGLESDAEILRVDGGDVAVRFGPLRRASAVPVRPVVLVQGLAKGDKNDAIVRDATELGATRIVVATTARAVVKLDPVRATSRRARWVRIAEEAARQAGRGQAPIIEGPCTWTEALGRVGADAARFCLYEGATEPLAPALAEALEQGAPLAFAVGPEGGFEEAEVEQARAAGWKVRSIGPLTLRTETVAAAVLGAVAIWGAR